MEFSGLGMQSASVCLRWGKVRVFTSFVCWITGLCSCIIIIGSRSFWTCWSRWRHKDVLRSLLLTSFLELLLLLIFGLVKQVLFGVELGEIRFIFDIKLIINYCWEIKEWSY